MSEANSVINAGEIRRAVAGRGAARVYICDDALYAGRHQPVSRLLPSVWLSEVYSSPGQPIPDWRREMAAVLRDLRAALAAGGQRVALRAEHPMYHLPTRRRLYWQAIRECARERRTNCHNPTTDLTRRADTEARRLRGTLGSWQAVSDRCRQVLGY